MSKALLVRYIQMALAEAPLARVPNQLVSPDAENGDGSADSDEEKDNVQEFSGVGAIAGYTAPLGMSPDRLGRKKNRRAK